MTEHVCTLSWDENNKVITDWQPAKGIFSVGDRVVFESPGGDISLVFQTGSPFEPHADPIRYEVRPGERLSRELRRPCFGFTYRTGDATAIGDLPTEFGGSPGHYTCTLSAKGSDVNPDWNPPRGLFRLQDTISFQSPYAEAKLEFPGGSPFEDHAEPVTYSVPAGGRLDVTVRRSCFVFNCWPGGEEIAGEGDSVPTSGGGR
jgi:hypothetical protein